MTDIVERAYIAVSEDYCQGTEWCWSGVGEPLRRFADIVVLSETEALRAENAKLKHVLKLALEYWAHRQQRYKNRHPAWVIVARAMMGESDE